MKILQEFVVAQSPDVVWRFLQDAAAVAQCLPGAELTGQDDQGAFVGRLSAKMGPMTAAFDGKATITARPADRSATIEGKGVDHSGGSRGQVKVVYAVAYDDHGSKVSVDADIHLSGPVAQFGRTGLINEMSKRLIGEFVSCLEAKLAADSEREAQAITAGEVRGFSLLFLSLWAWVKRLFGGGGS